MSRVHHVFRTRNVFRSAAAICALTLCWAMVATPAAGSGQAAAADSTSEDAAHTTLPPTADASQAEWESWTQAQEARAHAHDWVADSAARGCELTDLNITTEVDPAHNADLGAPADLATVRVDRTEQCEESVAAELHTDPAETTDHAATDSDAGVASVPPGARCNAGTRGPGTICLSSAGGWITASWQNRSSSSVTGFLRVYQIPSSAGHCPTGTTWLTSPTLTWASGQTRSTSRAQTQNGAYSAHIWRQNLVGHSNWGGTCAGL